MGAANEPQTARRQGAVGRAVPCLGLVPHGPAHVGDPLQAGPPQGRCNSRLQRALGRLCSPRRPRSRRSHCRDVYPHFAARAARQAHPTRRLAATSRPWARDANVYHRRSRWLFLRGAAPQRRRPRRRVRPAHVEFARAPGKNAVVVKQEVVFNLSTIPLNKYARWRAWLQRVDGLMHRTVRLVPDAKSRRM